MIDPPRSVEALRWQDRPSLSPPDEVAPGGDADGWVIEPSHPHSGRAPFHVYAYETERDFDVAIETPTGSFSQSDEQGILRYGIGAELRLKGPLHLRGAIGTTRADFGSAVTNIDPDGEVELGLGVLYSF